jgi:hypothetical protein
MDSVAIWYEHHVTGGQYSSSLFIHYYLQSGRANFWSGSDTNDTSFGVLKFALVIDLLKKFASFVRLGLSEM